MVIKKEGNGVTVSDFGGINLENTLFCGQAFRWEKDGDGAFCGVVRGKAARIVQKSEDCLLFEGAKEAEIAEIWADYLDLTRDYGEIIKKLSRDATVGNSIKKNGIIHILNQEPWEGLCSFVISQCNNIPRIRGIVKRLCDNFGEEITGTDMRAFPSAEKIAAEDENSLAVLHAGYRTEYILNAARAVASGEIDLEKLKKADMNDAERTLMSIRGVGKKVADCAMLYSLGFFDCYPVDRHIARANAEIYPAGLPECFDGARGPAQQYIFLRQRNEE